MELIRPADRRYDAARRVWNLARDCRPTVICYCQSVDDARRALDDALRSGLPFSVRSGGHNQAGYGVCDGVVIDLSGLNAVSVGTAEAGGHTGTVRAGGGTRVSQLLDALPPGVVTPTGTCPDVGVSGLTLGGGAGLLMARHGAACDNLLAADVITARGDIVTATATSDSDLFWALRGGGGNFGVVTSLTLRTHRVDRVLAGRWLFPVGRTRDVVRRYRDLVHDVPDEFQTSGGLVSSDGEPMLFVAVCHCGDAASAATLVDAWRAALRPETDEVAWQPFTANLMLPPVAGDGTGAFLPDLRDDIVDVLAEAFGEAPPTCTAAWNDYHGAVTRLAVDATAFPLRRHGFDLFVHAGWKTPDREPASSTSPPNARGRPSAPTTTGCASSRRSTTPTTSSG